MKDGIDIERIRGKFTELSWAHEDEPASELQTRVCIMIGELREDVEKTMRAYEQIINELNMTHEHWPVVRELRMEIAELKEKIKTMNN
jgi:hypothetical protein